MFLAMILKLKDEKITMTKPGSIDYLLYGPRPSTQSVNIKIGNRLELLLNEFSEKMGFPIHKLAKTLVEGHQVDTLFVMCCFVFVVVRCMCFVSCVGLYLVGNVCLYV